MFSGVRGNKTLTDTGEYNHFSGHTADGLIKPHDAGDVEKQRRRFKLAND